MELGALLAASDEELLGTYSHFYIPRRNPAFLRRNALVALGNSGGPDAVAVAIRYLQDPDPLLRAHAAWALGRLGGPEVPPALAEALAAEVDAGVRAEIEGAQAAAAAGAA